MAVKRLPGAYRSRPRPSSTPGAKASTVCPYYLDGDQERALGLPCGGLAPAENERTKASVSVVSLALTMRFSRAAERRGAGTPLSHGLSKLSSMRLQLEAAGQVRST